MKSSTETLIKALGILAQEIQSDGVANAAIAEAAGRLAELEQQNAELVAQVNKLNLAIQARPAESGTWLKDSNVNGGKRKGEVE